MGFLVTLGVLSYPKVEGVAFRVHLPWYGPFNIHVPIIEGNFNHLVLEVL